MIIAPLSGFIAFQTVSQTRRGTNKYWVRAMDLMPPLTRSSVSTPRIGCPSDASSSDYPSPSLFGNNHSMASSCESDPPCSTASAQGSDAPSPHLESVPHSEWGPASVLHPALTSASMDNVLSPDYDTIASYDNTHLHTTSSSQGFYSARGQASPAAAALSTSRSPVSSLARLSMQFPPLAVSSPGTPRLKAEDLGSDYGHGLETSQYPSPILASAPYPPGLNSALPPLAPPTPGGPPLSNSAYADAPWARSEQYLVESDQVYTSAYGFQSPAMLPARPALQRTRSGSHERRRGRPQRKLTTKEEANFQCEFKGCGQLFSRKYNYKAHKETHDEKREYPFPCTVEDCTKKFVRKTDLQRHNQSVHMKERNHVCDYCGRPFARRDTLKRLAATLSLGRNPTHQGANGQLSLDTRRTAARKGLILEPWTFGQTVTIRGAFASCLVSRNLGCLHWRPVVTQQSRHCENEKSLRQTRSSIDDVRPRGASGQYRLDGWPIWLLRRVCTFYVFFCSLLVFQKRRDRNH